MRVRLTQGHVGVSLVAAVEEAEALVRGGAPVGQQPLHQRRALEQHVVHVAVGLPVQGHGARLALGADAARPRRVLRTPCDSPTRVSFVRAAQKFTGLMV